jgi:hypothetical protein
MKHAEYASDKRKEPHTLSILPRGISSRVRIALMHTGSP